MVSLIIICKSPKNAQMMLFKIIVEQSVPKIYAVNLMVSIYKQNNNLLTGPVTNHYFSIKPFYSKKRTNSRLSIFEN
jgi:hypothetical protein